MRTIRNSIRLPGGPSPGGVPGPRGGTGPGGGGCTWSRGGGVDQSNCPRQQWLCINSSLNVYILLNIKCVGRVEGGYVGYRMDELV